MYPVSTLGHKHSRGFQSLSTKSSLGAFKQMTSRAPSVRNKYLTAKVSSAVLGRCDPHGPAAVSLLRRTADARLKRELRCYLMLSDSPGSKRDHWLCTCVTRRAGLCFCVQRRLFPDSFRKNVPTEMCYGKTLVTRSTGHMQVQRARGGIH